MCGRIWKNKDNLWDDGDCDVPSHFVCNECEWNVGTKYVLLPHTHYSSQIDAEQACRDTYGTNLASIHSEDDFAETKLLCEFGTDTVGDVDGCWIGLYNNNQSGGYDFRWNDKTSFTFGQLFSCYPWNGSNPNNNQNGGRQYCVELVCVFE